MPRSKMLKNRAQHLSQLSVEQLKEQLAACAQHERAARFNKGRRASKQRKQEIEAELASRLGQTDD